MKFDANAPLQRMPGHWLLARMGKRVLRPGGLSLTRWMLGTLGITREDHVLELAPGMGRTAELALQSQPARYVGVDRDEGALSLVSRRLGGEGRAFVNASAEETGLPDASFNLAYGEAFLTMQTEGAKKRILGEVGRVLRPGGRYGMHEMCLLPDELDAETKALIQRDLADVIRVNARPLTPSEWKQAVGEAGLEVEATRIGPMGLLNWGQFIRDEGIVNSARILGNLAIRPAALKRVLRMRQAFMRHSAHLGSIGMVARKKKGLASATLLALVAIASSDARAIGMEKGNFFSGKYVGIGSAAASSVSGAESIFFNPAGLSSERAGQVVINLDPTFPSIHAPVLGPDRSDASRSSVRPVGTIMASYPLSSTVALGAGIYPLAGLGSDFGELDMGAPYKPSLNASLMDLESSIGAAWTVAPGFRVGAGWRFSYFQQSSAAPTTQAPSGLGTLRLRGMSGFNALGFRAGAQYQDSLDRWGIGAFARTPMEIKTRGRAELEEATGLTALGDAESRMTLPLAFGVGGNLRLHRTLRAHTQYTFTQYSRNESQELAIGERNMSIPLQWKDMHQLHFGLEYSGIRNLVLRCGYIFSSQVTSSEFPQPLFAPPGDAHNLSLGLTTAVTEAVEVSGAIDQMLVSGYAADPKGVNAGRYQADMTSAHLGVSVRM